MILQLLTALTVFLFTALVIGGRAHPTAPDLKVRQWHHGYLGILLTGLGFLWGGLWLQGPGLVMLADDALQHSVQATGLVTWTSPLRWAYNRLLAPLGAVRWLTGQLDRLLGRSGPPC